MVYPVEPGRNGIGFHGADGGIRHPRSGEDAGVERKHAEAYAEAIATAVHSADLATKNDMETALAATKNDMETALAALESRLTIRFYGAQLATVALVVALLKLLP